MKYYVYWINAKSSAFRAYSNNLDICNALKQMPHFDGVRKVSLLTIKEIRTLRQLININKTHLMTQQQATFESIQNYNLYLVFEHLDGFEKNQLKGQIVNA